MKKKRRAGGVAPYVMAYFLVRAWKIDFRVQVLKGLATAVLRCYTPKDVIISPNRPVRFQVRSDKSISEITRKGA
ncbi:MAG: hypothetical protein FWF44_01330 [Defluviitaleaceae bacterium]|nr:hypothetical protein [Defluviitaleaceae bacterium]